ncbi:hypothetical protein C2845_PM13G05920 [Panicum miliaceum]|uniref:Uncharacterized protein n=1 Tax=Panicum miliaceum TaxID=4540 RepID=A0A3L6RL55_PANMI|nr:hypothetical protein C2845_PM13G05920 [Panicum miliaceum]
MAAARLSSQSLHQRHRLAPLHFPTQPFPPAAAARLLPQDPILRRHSLVLRRLQPPLRPGHVADLGPLADPSAAVSALAFDSRGPVPRDLLAACHEPTTARSSSTMPTTSRSSPRSVPSRATRPPRGSPCTMGSARHGEPPPRSPQEGIVHEMDCGKKVLVVTPAKVLPLQFPMLLVEDA